MNQGTPPLITEKTRTDSLKMIEGIRWSRHVQCTLQLFLLLFIGECSNLYFLTILMVLRKSVGPGPFVSYTIMIFIFLKLVFN